MEIPTPTQKHEMFRETSPSRDIPQNADQWNVYSWLIYLQIQTIFTCQYHKVFGEIKTPDPT